MINAVHLHPRTHLSTSSKPRKPKIVNALLVGREKRIHKKKGETEKLKKIRTLIGSLLARAHPETTTRFSISFGRHLAGTVRHRLRRHHLRNAVFHLRLHRFRRHFSSWPSTCPRVACKPAGNRSHFRSWTASGLSCPGHRR